MKILLDTNALIWLLSQEDGGLLGKQARASIHSADIVYVSSVSILEIQIKTMLGKIKSSPDLIQDIDLAGLKNLSFDTSHANAIGNFSNLSKHDPFDRMLLAQSQVESLVLLTSDSVLLDLKLPFILNARK
ncbi:MAG TPA: type II toxin-antitoxin system VapC family toxin [Candidatus Saccharimonadia bacterium]|nr:type II toxin-antitoxin system VapC family toxin [Candidatus Saccharimonadia bacterium]